MWQVVSPWVDPTTRQNVSIHGASDYQHLLCAYVGAANVPLAFGGTDATPLGEAPEELALRAFVDAGLRKAAATEAAAPAAPAAAEAAEAVTAAKETTEAATAKTASEARTPEPPSPLLPRVLPSDVPSAAPLVTSSSPSLPDAAPLEALANAGVAALLQNAWSPLAPGWTLLKADANLRLTVHTRSSPLSTARSADDGRSRSSSSSRSSNSSRSSRSSSSSSGDGPAPRQFRATAELPFSASEVFAAVLDNAARLGWDRSVADLVTLSVGDIPLPPPSPLSLTTQGLGLSPSGASASSSAFSSPPSSAAAAFSYPSFSSPASYRSAPGGSSIVPFYGLMHCTTKQVGPVAGRDFIDAIYAGPLSCLPQEVQAAAAPPNGTRSG
jgi:hypothetical protein